VQGCASLTLHHHCHNTHILEIINLTPAIFACAKFCIFTVIGFISIKYTFMSVHYQCEMQSHDSALEVMYPKDLPSQMLHREATSDQF
jgi:hypothetical protein